MTEEWISDRLIPDEAFAAAYDAVGDEGRAVLKNCLARLWACYPPVRCAEVATTLAHEIGMRTSRLQRPYSHCLFLLHEYVPATRLLAAILPAMTSGIPRLSIVFVEHEPTDEQLTALELAGAEEVLACSTKDSKLLINDDFSEPRLLVTFGRTLQADKWGSLSLPGAPHIGVWLSGGTETTSPDLSRLAAMHSDALLEIWNGSAPDVDCKFSLHHGEINDFSIAASDYDAVLIPENEAGHFAHVPLVLHSGYEDFWMWPQVTADTFFKTSLVIS